MVLIFSLCRWYRETNWCRPCFPAIRPKTLSAQNWSCPPAHSSNRPAIQVIPTYYIRRPQSNNNHHQRSLSHSLLDWNDFVDEKQRRRRWPGQYITKTHTQMKKHHFFVLFSYEYCNLWIIHYYITLSVCLYIHKYYLYKWNLKIKPTI